MTHSIDMTEQMVTEYSMDDSITKYGHEFVLMGDTVVLPLGKVWKHAAPKLPPAVGRIEYDGEDERQRIALAVAWKSRSTQPLRIGEESLRQHMADCVGVAMVAAHEEPTLSDYERALYKSVPTDTVGEDGKRVYEKQRRAGSEGWSAEELRTKALFRHVERAVGRYVKEILRGARVVMTVADLETAEEPEVARTVTAKRCHDEYLKDAGSEIDRLDMLVEKACQHLMPKQQEQLRALIRGTAKLSDFSPKVRKCLQLAALDVLHMA